MQCYSELLPPSGISHSLYLSFTASDARNLIVAKTSVLQIFSLKQIDQGQDTKLVSLAEYSLPGTITSLGRVRPLQSKSGGDAILVAFRDAKLSLIEWDPAQHSISTISIHYYENHDLLLCPWSPDLSECVSQLTIDPSSRCAAFNFGVSNLAIIPFHQDKDDLAMDDLDDSDDEQDKPNGLYGDHTNGSKEDRTTPYAPSFVLPMIALDPGLLHPVDMAFLHEYREPTIGILYSSLAQSKNMSLERKDIMVYAVYTLDLEQKASTTLLSITKLPNDLQRVIALPPPIGGALLLGGNEMIHIDQGGRANAIGVNEFAKECSAFSMADHSEYKMRLEGCQLCPMGSSNNDMLIVLASGKMVTLNFRMDGRSVSGLSLQRMDEQYTKNISKTRASTMSNMGSGVIFIGNEESDSVLIGLAKKALQLKRHASRGFQYDLNGETAVSQADFDDEDLGDDPEEDADDDDDLYADIPINGDGAYSGAVEASNFRILDRLACLAPMNDIAIGKPSKRKREDELDEIQREDKLDLAIACGRAGAGSLVLLSRDLVPKIVKRHNARNISALWSLSSEAFEEGSTARPFDDILIVSESADYGTNRSSLLSLSGATVETREGTEFDGGSATIAAGRISSNKYTVISPSDVRVYDVAFGLSQIFPIVDEDAGTTARAVSATIMDPYVLILKQDSTVSLLKADKNGELDEVDLPAAISSESIISAALYKDKDDFFGTSKYYPTSSKNPVLLALLTSEGNFTLQSLPNLNTQIFQFSGLRFLPTLLSPDTPNPKHWRNKDDISEIIIADIGDASDQQPYLIVRNTTGDISAYQPYSTPSVEGSYRFRKVLSQNADFTDEYDPEKLDTDEKRSLPRLSALLDLDGRATVFISGEKPSVLCKEASGPLCYHTLNTGEMKHITSFHDSSCSRGLAYIDTNNQICFAEIPSDAILSFQNWVISKVELAEEVTALAYYDRTQSYVLATNHFTEFHLPRDDEWHPEWENEPTQFLPTVAQSSLKLLSTQSHSVIHQYDFDVAERVLSLKCLNLEISEETHERKDMIVVGTAITKGENVVTRGMIYIFDVVDVVPRPDILEPDLRLKLITKEDVRGAVTSICDIGSQGFLLAAQGQKCMVRGLREDNAILPVAFLDLRYYVSVAKELRGSGLTILGDAFSGLWLVGYSEEPYKMQLLASDLENPSVVSAEFMPDAKELHIISSDSNGELRILQYDPENPKTDRGTKLLLRSTFNTGTYPTTMTLLPRTPTSTEASNLLPYSSNSSMSGDASSSYPSHQILITTQSGSLALITPLTENTYRRLSTLQNILMTNLEHPCGLNPRAYRAVETDGLGGRGMIDGNLVRRWLLQSTQHKGSMADKVGGTVWEVRGDLEGVLGAGLGYF